MARDIIARGMAARAASGGGGGGGSSDVMRVSFTIDPGAQTVVADKTPEEVWTAFANGTFVFGYLTTEAEIVYLGVCHEGEVSFANNQTSIHIYNDDDVSWITT